MKKLIPAFALSFCLVSTVHRTDAQVVGGYGITGNTDFFCSLLPPGAPSNYLMCGASLIHPQWVLTAAHCVYDNSAPVTSVDVMIAPYIPGSGINYTRLGSEKIFVHTSYSSTGQSYDIALIKLKKPVTTHAPISLPAQGDNSLTTGGAACHIAGFGIYDLNNPFSQPDTLQYAEIEIIDNNTCNQPALYAGSIEPEMLCAGMLTGGPKGGASGDSGGPLWVNSGGKQVQIGLVSFGKGYYSTTDGPGVFTRLASYRQWIDSIIAKNSVSVDDVVNEAATITRTENEITVKLDETTTTDLAYTIYNYEGRMVQTGVWGKGRNLYTANIASLPNTLHFIHISNHGDFRYTGKLPLLR